MKVLPVLTVITPLMRQTNAVEAVVDEGQQIAKQLGKRFHGNPLQARSRSETDQAWTGRADRREQEFSSGR